MKQVQDYRDMDRLERLTRISGSLVNQTPLRVGRGRESLLESTIDLAVIRLGGKPYIPGSSLKGVFRATAEMLAASLGVMVHPPWEPEEGNPCVICGIFGSPKLSSHLRVYDAHPVNSTPVFIKPGVLIDRDFGSVKEGPFFEEFVEPGVEWKFEVEIVNIGVFPQPEDERGKILYQLLRMLRNPGLQVGARKTIGAGRVILKEGKWEVFTIKGGELTLEKSGGL